MGRRPGHRCGSFRASGQRVVTTGRGGRVYLLPLPRSDHCLQSASAERVLWCCKASLTPASPNRSRILSILRRLLVPGERNRWTLSPVVFQSVAHGLFVLQTFLHSPQGAPLIQTELDLSKDLVDQFLAGSYGEVDEAMAEEEYGVVSLPHDTKSTLRKAIFLEALVRCIEHCTATTRAWLLLNVTEVCLASSLTGNRIN